MAIFYDRIKGVNGGEQNSDFDIYTYLVFQEVERPKILRYYKNRSTGVPEEEDYGNIVTTLGNQNITGIKTFENLIKVNNTLYEEEGVFTEGSNFSFGSFNEQGPWLERDSNQISFNQQVNFTDFLFATTISASGDISAAFFNATSDIRAKENIQEASFAAGELVDNVEIKQFNYINNKKTTVGVIAQDLLKKQPTDISLVNNTNASGLEGDFMTIDETKLIYILWKALQETRAEVEELKQQLKK